MKAAMGFGKSPTAIRYVSAPRDVAEAAAHNPLIAFLHRRCEGV
jgi:hypothetical protein